MRHGKKLKKIGRTSSHRKSMLCNLARAIVEHEQIQTTVVKAKVLRPFIEKMITKARDPSLANKRLLLAKLHDINLVNKLVDIATARYKERPGGYTRIIKTGFRNGDNAPMAIIEMLDHNKFSQQAS